MKKNLLMMIILLLLLISPFPTFAYRITVQWDANTEADLEGYNVYIWSVDGNKQLIFCQEVGTWSENNEVIYYIPYEFQKGVTYNIAVTAYDTNGLESEYSNTLIIYRSGEFILDASYYTPVGAVNIDRVNDSIKVTLDTLPENRENIYWGKTLPPTLTTAQKVTVALDVYFEGASEKAPISFFLYDVLTAKKISEERIIYPRNGEINHFETTLVPEVNCASAELRCVCGHIAGEYDISCVKVQVSIMSAEETPAGRISIKEVIKP